MAGCFGNSAEDRFRERQLDLYLDSQAEADNHAERIVYLAEDIAADNHLLDDLLCTNNNNSQFISDVFAAFNEYRNAPFCNSGFHDLGISVVHILREYIELVSKQHAEHIYNKDI